MNVLLASWMSDPMTPARWLLVIVGLPIAATIEVLLVVGYKHATRGP